MYILPLPMRPGDLSLILISSSSSSAQLPPSLRIVGLDLGRVVFVVVVVAEWRCEVVINWCGGESLYSMQLHARISMVVLA